MPWTNAILVIAAVGGMLLLDTLIVRTLVRAGWDGLAHKFPPAPVAPDAVRREFQSFGFNLMNLGLCVHVAADSTHLHLLPSAFLRWCRCGPISIPWEALEVRRRGRRFHTVRAGGVTIKGPAWCLSLADPASPTRASN